MTNQHFNIGLAGYGLFLPQELETAAQIAVKSGLAEDQLRELGIDSKYKPGPEDQPIVMAVKAAKQALENTPEVRPEEVDLVLWTGEEYKDYIAQTASIRLQEEVGCKNAWAFDLVGQGTTSLVGLRVARDMMIGDESIKTVLLAGGTRNVDLVDYGNRETAFLLASSASGGALILKRDLGRNILKKIAIQVDPKMADEVYVPGGGTENPFSPENLGSKEMFYQVRNRNLMIKYLDTGVPRGIIKIIGRVCGSEPADFLALRHLPPAQREWIFRETGVAPDPSGSLERIGHHGPNDVIISLDAGLKSGTVRDGQKICLASAGIGFTYGAALIEWGLSRG